MQIDSHQDIWLRTFSDKFYKYVSRLDSIIEYPFNDKIQEISQDSIRSDIFEFYISNEDTLYVSVGNNGLVKLDKSGQLIHFRPKVNEEIASFINVDSKVITYSKGVNLSSNNNDFFQYQNGIIALRSRIKYGSNYIPVKLRKGQKKFSNRVGFMVEGDKICYYNAGHLYLFKDTLLLCIMASPAIKDLVELPTMGLLTAELEAGGVKYYESIQDIGFNIFIDILSDVSVSKLFLAQDDILIVTTLEDGVFILKPTEIAQIKTPLVYERNLINIQGTKLSDIFINIDYTSVANFNISEKEQILEYNNSSNKLFYFFYDPGTEVRLFGLWKNAHFIKNEVKIELGPYDDGSVHIPKKVRILENGNYLVLTAVGLLVYDNWLKPPILNTYPFFSLLEAVDAIDYKGDFLLGCRDGLYVLEDDSKIKLDSIHSFFNYRVNSIEKHMDNYYLGTLGGGLGIWDGEEELEIINTDDGLISNNIERLVVDSSGTIVLCTKAGISVLRGEDSSTITNYTRKHGLPSNEVNDALIINDTIIVATSNGLAYIADGDMAIVPKMPLIESFLVNNIPWQSHTDVGLNFDENSVSIAFKALDYTQDGDINYSYALNGEEWQYTNKTEVDFASLQPGDYEFSVRAANRDGIWSDAREVSFSIDNPWWKKTWFYLLCVFGLLLEALLFYRNRVNSINEKNKIQQEINQLERSALQAQMNPHFIFNCLNSIQSYIMSNDKDQAMEYLARFAKLIRQNLRVSSESQVALDVEISMLENYIELERMRFRDSFNYTIELDKTIDPQALIIPPLIIQPYIENAIIHGMKKKKGDGLIEISFTPVDDFLLIKIKDNGGGIQHDQDKPSDKSLGMSITQQRLSHLSSQSGNSYNLETTSDEKGTIISISIKPLKRSSEVLS